jgi:hypothetical protein
MARLELDFELYVAEDDANKERAVVAAARELMANIIKKIAQV